MLRRVGSPVCLLLALFALLAPLAVAGCGSADQSREEPKPEDPEPEPELVDFLATVNLCPRFVGSLITPSELGPDGVAYISVRAEDPDDDDRKLVYTWSASSGEVSAPAPDGRVEYRCDEGGEQVITVIAADVRDCEASLEVHVTCFAD
jgi:hypothetical protein